MIESAQLSREDGAMNRLLRYAGVVVSLLAASEPSLAKAAVDVGSERVALEGAVYSVQDSHPINQAEIRLCTRDGNMLGIELSDETGGFRFRGLSPAAYLLSVAAAGFERQDTPVDLSFSSEPGLAIYLKPEAGKPHEGPPTPSVSAHEMTMPPEVRDLVAAAKKKMWLEKNLEAGIVDLRKALAAAPNYYEVYCELGLAYIVMGKTSDAEANFRKSLELSGGKFGDAQVGLGSALINKGDIAAGEEALRRGVEASPGSWLGRYELSKLELSRNHVTDAEKLAEQARSLAPNFPSVYRLLANIHTRQKNYAALLRDIDAYLQLDSASPAAVRARQMREEILEKMTTEVATAPTSAVPQ